MLDRARHLDQLRRDGERLLAVAGGALDAAVPTCPGWTVADLVAHTARVHHAIAAQVRERATGPVPRDEVPAAPGPDAVVDFGAAALDTVVAALADVDPAEPLWTWGPTPTAAFYIRRAAHETTIHRVDAEAAVDAVTPVDADVAVDLVDELYDTVVPHARRREPLRLPAATLHLHRTDGEGEWLLAADGDRIVMTHEHAKGDAAARGSASDLATALWGRPGRDRLEIFGDETVFDAWAALAP
ncbi:MAG: maleylpyruvate isomerase family mycothiol-dependent enzyme [Actinomyces sp.]|nr:MAG: maleylpyruvate isomerase family mycothiol-dependent enzyme [Actinomyces sp.]